jgi:hypothetical protein
LLPHQRHALMRDTVMGIAQRHKGITCKVEDTVPATTTYVALYSGHSVLTIAHVDDENDLPRWARYRETLAGGINFDLLSPITDNRRMYGLLLFGPPVNYQHIQNVPAYVNIGIPAADYDCYVGPTHSLYDEFPGVVEDVFGVRPAEIRQAIIELRRRAARDGWAS